MQLFFKQFRIFVGLGLVFVLAACEEVSTTRSEPDSKNSTTSANINVTVPERTVLVRNFSNASNQDAKKLGIDSNRINSIKFQVTGGEDRALFGIGKNAEKDTILFFNDAPDFEVPADADEDNVYKIELTGSLANKVVKANVTVTVSDVLEKLLVLNDTGVTLCGDYAFDASGNHSNTITCLAGGVDAEASEDLGTALQDARAGRDNAAVVGESGLSKVGAGAAGFDFTKLDSSGSALDAEATSWDCVKDNYTGLVWEEKASSGLRANADSFAWFNEDAKLNGGADGDNGNSQTCTGYEDADGKRCNTADFVAQINEAGLCGAKDWRLPTVDELQGIIHYGAAAAPLLDTDYFKNAQANAVYWSVTPSVADTANAWAVDSATGTVLEQAKSSRAAVRLVRGAR